MYQKKHRLFFPAFFLAICALFQHNLDSANIELINGTTFNAELIEYRDDRFCFEHDILGKLSIIRDEIKHLEDNKSFILYFPSQIYLVDSIEYKLDEQQIIAKYDQADFQYQIDKIVGILPHKNKDSLIPDAPLIRGATADLSACKNSGNSSTATAEANLSLHLAKNKAYTQETDWSLDSYLNYKFQENNETTTLRQGKFSIDTQKYLSSKLSLFYQPLLSFDDKRKLELENQQTLGISLHQHIHRLKIRWKIGGGYTSLNYRQRANEEYISGLAAYALNWPLTPRLRLLMQGDFKPKLTNLSQYQLNLTQRLEVPVQKVWKVFLQHRIELRRKLDQKRTSIDRNISMGIMWKI